MKQDLTRLPVLCHPASIVTGLIDTIRDAYGIQLSSLEYLPVGFVGIHYKAKSPQGNTYFITLYDGSRLAQISAQRLPFTLPVIHHLRQSGQFTELAAPLPTRQGDLWAAHGGMPVILFPYLEGHLLAQERASEDLQAELGRLVARLHQVSLDPGIKDPIQEAFTLHFEAPLRQALEDLEHLPSHVSQEKTALRDLLLPQSEKIRQLLQRLHELAAHMRQATLPFVICHTDLHPWNMIRTAGGRLVVVDWEGVCLAPAEHDLFIFTGPGFKTFLRAYYHAGGKRALTAEGFAFYFYRRNLEDLADFILRILKENGGEERDQKDLEGIRQDCMAGWTDLDTALERMRDELAAS